MYKFLITGLLVSIVSISNAKEDDEYKYNIKLEFGTNIQTDMKSSGHVKRTNSPINFGFGISKQFEDVHLGIGSYHNNLKAQGVKKDTLYTQEFNIHALFATLEYDIYQGKRITPFLTVGGGIAYNKTDAYIGTGATNGIYIGKKNLSPAYNLGAGMRINIDENHKLLVGYKYYDLGTAKTSNQVLVSKTTILGDNIKTRVNHHSIFMALVLQF